MNDSPQRLPSRAGHRHRPARRGFALIVTLSLMTLLLLMVLTLTVLVRVNMQTATTNLVIAEARQNALVGAQIGLGQLQKFAGPDQRVTTAADIGAVDDNNIGHLSDEPVNEVGFPGIFPNGISQITKPYGAGDGYGGTRFWTAVWANQFAPLSIYTAANTTTNPNPTPVLLTFLVSGNENAPLIMGPAVASRTTNQIPGVTMTGNVSYPTGYAPPALPNYFNFSSNTSLIASASTGINKQSSWNALTDDLSIKDVNNVKQPAIMLAGPNTVGTNNPSLPSYSLSISGGSTFATNISPLINEIIVPMVNITVPNDQTTTTNNVTGRMAYWVRDEGLKAKYTPTDPYAGQQTTNSTGGTPAGALGQVSRYRFYAPQRSGMERMDGFGNYSGVGASLFPTTATITQTTASSMALMNQIFEPSQILLVDGSLSKTNQPTSNNPQAPLKYIQQHFNDFTTYSYGLETDTLRGGLRYDLTTAFEPISNPNRVFSDTQNGLMVNTVLGKSFLPYAGMAAVTPGTTNPPTTEPNAGMTAGGLIGPSFSGATTPGSINGPATAPEWSLLNSYYNIASSSTGNNNNLAGNANPIVTMVPGNSTTAGISPVIVQGRLAFGIYSNSNFQPCIAIYASFILANPYNFPIQATSAGLDLGYRISTNTGREWALNVIARDSDRTSGNTSSSPNGHFLYLFDDTTDPSVRTYVSGSLATGAGGTGFFSATTLPSNTGNSVDYGYGSVNGVGYFPILMNPISFPQNVGSGNNSVLDQVAFHISSADSLLEPGEARIYSLGLSPTTVPSSTTAPTSTGSGTVAIAGNFNLSGDSNVKQQPNFNLSNADVCVGYIPLNTNAGGKGAVTQFPLSIGFNQNTFILRAAGNRFTSPSAITANTTNYAGVPVGVANITNNVFPDPVNWGWLVEFYPSVACTVELRTGGSAPGVNVLQDIINMDLTGAGLTNPITSGAMPPSPTVPSNSGAAFRFDYTGTTGESSTTASASGEEKPNMPAFIGSYFFTMATPNSYSYSFLQNTIPPAGASVTVTPSNAIAFQNFSQYNLRAVNMALPPYMPFNSLTGATGTSWAPGASAFTTQNFMTVPPYFRFFDQGPPDGGHSPANITNAWTSFGQNLPSASIWGNDTAWGYTDVNPALASLAASTARYNVLYALPQRVNSTPKTTLTNPNSVLPPSQSTQVADVPILNIGQLTNADVTADDVWVSVGYQPGNAIGNSYSTPYVSRGNIVQTGPNYINRSGLIASTIVGTFSPTASSYAGGNTPTTSGNITPSTIFGTGSSNLKQWATGSANPTANAYDISYLMNTVLWDRYFFSGLYTPAAPPAGAPITANSRLVFKAGIAPTNAQLGIGVNGIPQQVTDPVTGQVIFRAYAPARYMMIDGAFNVNSTSYDAWRAVLSAMRNVSYLGAATTGATNIPRFMPSPQMSSNTTLSPSFTKSVQALADTTAGTDPQSYGGFRQLTDTEIDMLAMKIVQEVRLRGPFLSLAQFVNRRIGAGTSGDNDPHSFSGALQSAIDMNNGQGGALSNNALQGASTTSTSTSNNAAWAPANTTLKAYPDGDGNASATLASTLVATTTSANPNSRVAGIPAWLTQADILQAIGSIIAVRSDTFVIRAYGDVLNPLISQSTTSNPTAMTTAITNDPTLVEGRAWCEMVVQRYPDYIDTLSTSTNDDEPSATNGVNTFNPGAQGNNGKTLSPVNANFGRRFRVVSIRWLNATDI